jgi:hypothetical protein
MLLVIQTAIQLSIQQRIQKAIHVGMRQLIQLVIPIDEN